MNFFYVFMLMLSVKIICVESKPLIEELLQLLLPTEVDYPDEHEYYPGHQYPGFNNYNYYPGFLNKFYEFFFNFKIFI